MIINYVWNKTASAVLLEENNHRQGDVFEIKIFITCHQGFSFDLYKSDKK